MLEVYNYLNVRELCTSTGKWIDVSFEIGRMEKYTVIQCQNRRPTESDSTDRLSHLFRLVCIFLERRRQRWPIYIAYRDGT